VSQFTFYRYVQPSLVLAYEELGWMDLGPSAGHHGVHAHTMVLEGDEDPPPEPKRTALYLPDSEHHGG